MEEQAWLKWLLKHKNQKLAAVQLNIVYIYNWHIGTPISEMTYTVSTRTLNCTIPYHIGTDVC